MITKGVAQCRAQAKRHDRAHRILSRARITTSQPVHGSFTQSPFPFPLNAAQFRVDGVARLPVGARWKTNRAMMSVREPLVHLMSGIVPVVWDGCRSGSSRKLVARRNTGGCEHVGEVRGGHLPVVLSRLLVPILSDRTRKPGWGLGLRWSLPWPFATATRLAMGID